jgi:hypothetical protein
MKHKPRESRFRQTDAAVRALENFAHRFIQPAHSQRWIHMLCERPDKSYGALHRFDRQMVRGICHPVPGSSDRDDALAFLFGDPSGVFFDGLAPACLQSLSRTLQELPPRQDDALFTTLDGSKAIFFHHDGATWVCGFPESPFVRR